ncbi:hypothetical protein ACDX78_00700 [Virgibacillus oceani]
MTQKTVYSLIITLFFLTSCQQPDEKLDIIAFHPSDYDVFLLTDKSDTSIEEIYLDAIIELKAKYPDEFSQVSSEAKSNHEINLTINEEQNPILLITKNGQTVKELAGPTSKTEIKKHLEMTMEK